MIIRSRLKERSIIWQYITDDNLPMHILTEESKNQVTCWIKYIKYFFFYRLIRVDTKQLTL